MQTLRDLQTDCSHSATYARKNLHRIPAGPVVVRHKYLAERCRGKRVLSLGGSGPMEMLLRQVAASCVSVDRDGSPDVTRIDLDREPHQLKVFQGAVDLIVCGEVLEHLSNPGRLLDELRQLQRPMIVTAPNAFTTVGRQFLKDALENVNAEHVCWYSPTTLRTLLTRHGFSVTRFCWYNGEPIYAEGMIFEVV